MWDLQCYHLYNPFAALHDRYMVDVAAAQLQTYFNPLLDYPFYAAIALINDRPRLIAFAMGTVHGINLFCVAFIAWRCLRFCENLLMRGALALVAFAIGATGAGSVPLIGSVTGDLQSAVPILAGFCFLLLALDAAPARPRMAVLHCLVAGGLAGLALGAKPTAIIYCAGLAAALLVLPRPVIFQGLPSFVVGGFVGTMTTWGAHAARMMKLFGSPLFPLMNTIFRSPWWQIETLRDRRFIPASLVDAIFYPFGWAVEWNHNPDANHVFVSELSFRDIRLAFVFTLAALVAVLWGVRRFARHARETPIAMEIRALIIFGVVSYIVWLQLFAIYRYLMPLEMLSGLYIVLGLGALVWRRAWLLASLAAALACYMTTVPLDWGHIPFDDHYIEVHAPRLPPNTLIAIVGGDPVAYFIPLMDQATWISLDNNLLHPDQHNLLIQHEHDIVARHEGPLMVLDAGATPQAMSVALTTFGLASNFQNCQSLSSNIAPDPLYKLCPMTRAVH